MENDSKPENENPEESVDLSGLSMGGLDLSPDWARKEAGVASSVQPAPARGGRREFRQKPGRKPDRDQKSRPRVAGGGDRNGPRRQGRPKPPERPALPRNIRVSFVPDREALARVVRLMKHNRAAYSLKELAVFFMSRPNASMARFEVIDGADIHLYQVQADRSVHLSEESAQQAALAHHLESAFDREEVSGEAPRGEFKCVGRCRKTGALLGPPNYHAYGQAVTSLWSEHFANLSLEEYKKTIELVHDQEVIDAWKEQASKCYVYRPRRTDSEEGGGDPDAGEEVTLTASEVTQAFTQNLLPKAVKRTAKASVPHISLSRCESSLQDLARVVRNRETQRPSSIQFALRPAMKSSGMHLFKIEGVPYAGPVAPKKVGEDALAPELAVWIAYIREHPGATRSDVTAACGKSEEDSGNGLRLLIEQGHVILLSDHTLLCA